MGPIGDNEKVRQRSALLQLQMALSLVLALVLALVRNIIIFRPYGQCRRAGSENSSEAFFVSILGRLLGAV